MDERWYIAFMHDGSAVSYHYASLVCSMRMSSSTPETITTYASKKDAEAGIRRLAEDYGRRAEDLHAISEDEANMHQMVKVIRR